MQYNESKKLLESMILPVKKPKKKQQNNHNNTYFYKQPNCFRSRLKNGKPKQPLATA